MPHRSPIHPLCSLILVAACAGDPSSTDPMDTGVAPTTAPPPTVTEPTPVEPTGTVALRLIDEGQPVEGASVFVHDPTGALLDEVVTDASGRVTVSGVGLQGIGLTYPDGLGEFGGMSTVFGIHAGDDLTFGSEALRDVLVNFTVPYGFIDASAFEVRAGCVSTRAEELGQQGTLVVPSVCATGDAMDVAVMALDSSGEPIAISHVPNFEIDWLAPEPAVEAHLGAAGWSILFDDLVVHGEGVDREGNGAVDVWMPSRTSALFDDTQWMGSTAGDLDAGFGIPTALGDVAQIGFRVYDLAARATLRQSVDVGSSSLVRVPLAATMPTVMHGLSMDAGRERIAVAEPGTYRCGEETEPDATLFLVQITLDGLLGRWRIMSPGHHAGLFSVPELPNVDVGQVGEVTVVGHTGLDYSDALGAVDPFEALPNARLALGEATCATTLERFVSCGTSCDF